MPLGKWRHFFFFWRRNVSYSISSLSFKLLCEDLTVRKLLSIYGRPREKVVHLWIKMNDIFYSTQCELVVHIKEKRICKLANPRKFNCVHPKVSLLGASSPVRTSRWLRLRTLLLPPVEGKSDEHLWMDAVSGQQLFLKKKQWHLNKLLTKYINTAEKGKKSNDFWKMLMASCKKPFKNCEN